MNKIITILLVLVLCACTSQHFQPTNTNQPSFTSLTNNLDSRFNYNDLDAQNTVDEEQKLLPRLARYLKKGVASWYGSKFHGRKTASGEIFDMYAMTAAHNTLPISSYARVTNLENKRSVIVRINDRGPFHGNRVMDLSYAAAKKLDLHLSGSGAVEIKAIAPELALAQLQDTAETQEKSVYLQVGTFGNKKKAQKLHDKIVAHHLPQPKILPSTHKGSTLYKVQMGPIKSPASVHKLNLQLAKLGITTTQFVTDDNQKQIIMVQ